MMVLGDEFTPSWGDTDIGKGSSIYSVHIVFLNDFEFPYKAYGRADPPSGGFLLCVKRVI